MVLALWVAVGTLAAWVVFWQVIIARCLFELKDQTLKLESVDCETDNRLIRMKDRLELLTDRIAEYRREAMKHDMELRKRMDALEFRVRGLEPPEIVQKARGARQSSVMIDGVKHETTPDSHKPPYDVDWGKSGVTFKPFTVLNTAKGESQAVTAGFNSKLVTRPDDLQPKVTSAGDDLRAAEVLPGSPAAKVGSQDNHSSDLLRMFNAPPIICARGAILVERKGV